MRQLVIKKLLTSASLLSSLIVFPSSAYAQTCADQIASLEYSMLLLYYNLAEADFALREYEGNNVYSNKMSEAEIEYADCSSRNTNSDAAARCRATYEQTKAEIEAEKDSLEAALATAEDRIRTAEMEIYDLRRNCV